MQQEGREEAARQRALDREREWIAAQPARPPGQVEGPYPRL